MTGLGVLKTERAFSYHLVFGYTKMKQGSIIFPTKNIQRLTVVPIIWNVLKQFGAYPLAEIISSFSISTISTVLPYRFIIPSFLNSERVLITFAVLMLI